MTKSKFLILATFIIVLSLSACTNTFQGAGRDIESAGEWMQDSF